MSTFYSDMAATALALLTEYGQDVSIVRVTGGSVNPVTGVAVPGTSATTTAKGVLRRYPDRVVDGTRILRSDRELVLDAGYEPIVTDQFTVGGQNMTAISIETVSPAGTPIVYFVQVRR